MHEHTGDTENFDKNWKATQEAHYLHWTRGEPKNQIQLAFRNHWKTFQSIIGGELKSKRVLEVGCGRGSLSAYFADAGCKSTLLDLSETAIDLAKKAFNREKLRAEFIVGNCLDMPIEDKQYDVVFSIGLLEHFSDVRKVIEEQYRILDVGGIFIGYVVPEMKENIQSEYKWICDLLKIYDPRSSFQKKEEVYRSDDLDGKYVKIMKDIGFKDIESSGIYSLPMISPSVEFPFTLMKDEAEKILVTQFNKMLAAKKASKNGGDPWLCEVNEGQAFIVWGTK
jgi:ubiquinone/menaquinone biosynthesis C-methylase UbiE